MDREYIKTQRIVERYLSGDLIVREARDFERYCQEHADVLDTLPLPARLKARLAIKPFDGTDTSVFPAIPSSITRVAVEVEGKQRRKPIRDEDDDLKPVINRRRGVVPAMLFGMAILLIAFLLWQNHEQQQQIKTLATQAKVVKLRAPGNSQVVRIAPSDTLPDNPQVSISLAEPKLLDVHVDVSGTKFNNFALTIDKTDEARVILIRRMVADTNRELRLNLNSSAFGPGQYQIKLEGYDWRGETSPAGWVLLDMR